MATSPDALRRALVSLTGDALADLLPLLRVDRPAQSRSALLGVAPTLVAAYVEGSSALAADWYEELRDEARPRTRHLTLVPEWGRVEKYGNALAWATDPLLAEVVDLAEARSRLSSVTEYEIFGGFTGTAEANVRADEAARGWRRNARGEACKFCRMLADRGATYRKESTGRFAAHTNCRCTVSPVFAGGEEGPEASVMQYLASKRRTTAKDRARLRAYLNENYPDAHG